MSLQQTTLVEFCKKHNIHVTAYSSLGTTVANSPLLNDPVVLSVAERWHVSSARVLLKWALQKGFSVLPKSTNPDHIAENIDLDFDLDDQDMLTLDSIKTKAKYTWNPKTVA